MRIECGRLRRQGGLCGVALAGLLALGACAAAGGIPAEDNTRLDKAIDGDAAAEISALSDSMQWYAAGVSSLQYADDQWTLISELAFDLMSRAERGELSADSEERLRSHIVPFFASLERGRALSAAFETSCIEVDSASVLPYVVAAPGSQEAWSGSADEGWSQIANQVDGAVAAVQYGEERDGTFARELAIESAVSALLSVVHMRAALVPGELEQMSEPDRYAATVVPTIISAGLGDLTPDVQDALARRIALINGSLDLAELARLRMETARGISEFIDAIRSEAAADYRIAEMHGMQGEHVQARARIETACEDALSKLAAIQPLLYSETAVERICPYDARDYRPTVDEIPDYVAGMERSLQAYLERLIEAWNADPADRDRLLVHNNMPAVGAVLSRCPECAARACTALVAAREHEQSAMFWDRVVMWGSAIVGIIAVATGIGALFYGASAVVLGTTVGALASITAVTAAIAALPAAGYLGYRSARLLGEARRDMLATLLIEGTEVRATQLAEIEEDRRYANRLVLESLLLAAIVGSELALLMRFARAVRPRASLSPTERIRTLLDEAVSIRAAWRQHNANLRPLLESRRAHWSSRVLREGTPGSEAEVRQIVRQAMDDTDPLFAEVDDFLRAGGVDDTRLWDQYFRSYDNMLLYARDYQALASHADRVLPKNGLIIDAGAGTGNFTTTLAKGSSGRLMVAFEQSPGGVRTIGEKLARLFGEGHGHPVIRGDLRTAETIAQGADGAVVNNVLYTLGDDGERVLEMITRDLKPGGTLYLNDPLAEATSAANVQRFIGELAVDAWRAGAPLSAHDIAVIAAVNSGRLVRTSAGSRFRTIAELHELAGRLGLEVVEEGRAYLNTTYTMVLRKPSP